MLIARHQAGDVGHVDHEQAPDFSAISAKRGEVDHARIGAGARDDQLRLVLAGQRGDLIVVDALVSSRTP